MLGCILCLIYINGLSDILKEHNILFADGISVLVSCVRVDEVETRLNLILAKIQNWLKMYNLDRKINKSKIIQFFLFLSGNCDLSHLTRN